LIKINPSPGDDEKKDVHELHELTRKKRSRGQAKKAYLRVIIRPLFSANKSRISEPSLEKLIIRAKSFRED
jgi:hypothetical protein